MRSILLVFYEVEIAMSLQKKIYYKNFGTFLKGQYRQRKIKNDSYSLRSFARFLEISASLLSDYMSGKKEPLVKNKNRILKKLGIQKEQIDFFTNDISKDLYKELSASESNILYQWKAQAVLQAVTLIDFQPNPKWIATKLGLRVSEVNAVVEMLQKNGYLKISNVHWELLTPDFSSNVSADASLQANIDYQNEIIIQAKQALHRYAWKNHDQKSMQLTIEIKDLPDIKEEIKAFSRLIAAKYGNKSAADSIYQLSISFYPISIINENESIP